MSASEFLVDVRGVSKAYGPKRALDEVDLRVAEGEVVGLVGPNGAGKSTLMKVLCGVCSCTAGSGHVLESRIDAAAPRIPFVGVMIERPMFIESLDGRTNLRLLGGIRGGVEGARVEEVLHQVGLEGAGAIRVRQYSLGMRQRLSLAQAIMERPRLLILDEPTNGLDPDGILEMRELVRSLARVERAGVLVSSHLLAEVEAICDRVVLIDDGRVRGEFRPGGCDRGEVRLRLSDRSQSELVRATRGVVAVVEEGADDALGVRTSLEVPDLIESLVRDGVRIEAVYRKDVRLEDVYREALGRSS